MTRVFLADSQVMERSALRLLLDDLRMEVVGEADNWSNVLSQVPDKCPGIVIVEWDLLPQPTGGALENLRSTCAHFLIIVLLFNFLNPVQKADLDKEVDIFLSKLDSPQHITELLRAAALSTEGQGSSRVR